MRVQTVPFIRAERGFSWAYNRLSAFWVVSVTALGVTTVGLSVFRVWGPGIAMFFWGGEG